MENNRLIAPLSFALKQTRAGIYFYSLGSKNPQARFVPIQSRVGRTSRKKITNPRIIARE
jgi:hypothetical protein